MISIVLGFEDSEVIDKIHNLRELTANWRREDKRIIYNIVVNLYILRNCVTFQKFMYGASDLLRPRH